MHESDSNQPVACTLSAERETERAERIRSVLADSYEGTTEREDGYTFAFDGTDETLSAVATFVTNERQCCSFAEYGIDVSPPYERTRLTITGPNGTKSVFEELRERLEANAT